MEKADSYLEMKELIYDCMNAQEPDKNPISYGSHFSNNYTILLFDYEEHELMQAFIACGLFELEHHDLEERIEGQMGSINTNISESSRISFPIVM